MSDITTEITYRPHRWFIALEIPDEIRQELVGMFQEFSSQFDSRYGFNFMVPANMHITLSFIGELSDEKHKVLISELKDVVWSKFSLYLEKFKILYVHF